MSRLASPIQVQTAFAEYQLDTVLGEGVAGRVYGGRDASGNEIALKLLAQNTSDKRRRFRNEISFLSKAQHSHLVPVIDHGFSTVKKAEGPFYVMPRYWGSLRDVLRKGVEAGNVLGLFAQILDGVEAAHLLGATHRDLKPENLLARSADGELAVADFGVASFTADTMVTLVETGPGQRLANFVYAAPEQRVAGRKVTAAADIYALGLILNEMFTGSVPHGTSFRLIGHASNEHRYLDPIVAEMIAQDPSARPQSIAELKLAIKRHAFEAIQLQKLSQLDSAVIPEGQVDDPLAHSPPVVVDAVWNADVLTLTLDRPTSPRWADVLKYRLGSFTALTGVGPERFQFAGDTARVSVEGRLAQSAIDHFKGWLPQATNVYRHELQQELQRQQAELRSRLARERAAEEQRLQVNNGLRI